MFRKERMPASKMWRTLCIHKCFIYREIRFSIEKAWERGADRGLTESGMPSTGGGYHIKWTFPCTKEDWQKHFKKAQLVATFSCSRDQGVNGPQTELRSQLWRQNAPGQSGGRVARVRAPPRLFCGYRTLVPRAVAFSYNVSPAQNPFYLFKSPKRKWN